MAQSYQVGEGMYKGPLSTRSEVPEKDGNTFIQTDAGNNGNQFKFYHYNGGWAAQGWDLPSLSTDDATINGEPTAPSTHAARPAADRPEVQIGSMAEMRSAPDIVGTRQLVGMWPLTGGDDYSLTNSWTTINELTWSCINHPPNKTPVLATFVHYDNDTSNESSYVRIYNGGSEIYLFTNDTTSEKQHYKETYLVEEAAGLAHRSSMANGNWNIEAKATGTSGGTVYGDSSLLLYYEVI